jgi:hypothetical protein
MLGYWLLKARLNKGRPPVREQIQSKTVKDVNPLQSGPILDKCEIF